MKISVFQHHLADAPATISEWARQRGLELEIRRPSESRISAANISDALIVLGGPMGAYEHEKFPWLAAEIETIAECISRGKKTLGICLGAQLIASALGSRVYPHSHKQIGWFPLEKRDEAMAIPFLNAFPKLTTIFQWHGDTFDLPRHAIHLFQDSICKNQGFLFGKNALALQFHPEANPKWIETLISSFADEIKDEDFIQSPKVMMEYSSNANKLKEPFFKILDGFFGI